ncbi:MAG: SHOCT-like domain-containing protein [Aggregatilineales bacterium]
MTTSEERLKILDMIREGKLTADEGARLLQALQGPAKKPNEGREPRWMRVKVTDLGTGASKVSVNIPMGLVRVGMRMGARFTPRDSAFDYAGVMEAIHHGTLGKIVDLEDKGENERVEIWLE